MSESRVNGFFRPWHSPENENGTSDIVAIDKMFGEPSYTRQEDDDGSVVSSDGHLLEQSAVNSTSSSDVANRRIRYESESSDDVATSTTPSLQGEEVVGSSAQNTYNSRVFDSRPPSTNDTAMSHPVSVNDDGFNGSIDLGALEYLSVQGSQWRRTAENFAAMGEGLYSLPFANTNAERSTSAANSIPGFLYSLPISHPAIHLEIHRGIQTGFYPGILSPGFYNRSVQEAVQMVHQQDVAAKQIRKMRPKKFKCQHCDMAFSNNGQLKGHVRIHTGERPFRCDEESCGKSFTRNEELTRHKKIHTGDRPHSCNICGKRFGRKDHLKKHTRTHEVRDPYRVSAATLGVFALGHSFQQVAEIPYVY